MNCTVKLFFFIFLLFININAVLAQEIYFPPNQGVWDSLELSDLAWCEDKVAALDLFMEESNSKALIVLKDGKRVIESYYNDHTQNEAWYWASAGKSLTSVLFGIAQEEGLINIEDNTASILGNGWTSCENINEELIKVKHHLSMNTGLDYTGGMTDCTSSECLTCLNSPEEEWFYHNAPYTLISSMLEEVSGVSYNIFTGTRIGLDIGLAGLWSFNGDNRVFFSNARGMARFGILMQAEGEWNGNQLLEENYFLDMIQPSQNINPAYGYLWWLNGQDEYRLPGSTITFDGSLVPEAPGDLYAAIGKNGQILLVVPSDGLVIVRMGDNPDQSLVPLNYVRNLWDEISKLKCMANNVGNQKPESVHIYPNPLSNILNIESDHQEIKVTIYSNAGHIVYSGIGKTHDLSHVAAGIYILETLSDGKKSIQKVVIEN